MRTAPFGYLRLRKAEYDDAQLRSWAEWVRGAGFAQDVYVYFKHEEEGKGPEFARLLIELLPKTAVAQPFRAADSTQG